MPGRRSRGGGVDDGAAWPVSATAAGRRARCRRWTTTGQGRPPRPWRAGPSRSGGYPKWPFRQHERCCQQTGSAEEQAAPAQPGTGADRTQARSKAAGPPGPTAGDGGSHRPAAGAVPRSDALRFGAVSAARARTVRRQQVSADRRPAALQPLAPSRGRAWRPESLVRCGPCPGRRSAAGTARTGRQVQPSAAETANVVRRAWSRPQISSAAQISSAPQIMAPPGSVAPPGPVAPPGSVAQGRPGSRRTWSAAPCRRQP